MGLTSAKSCFAGALVLPAMAISGRQFIDVTTARYIKNTHASPSQIVHLTVSTVRQNSTFLYCHCTSLPFGGDAEFLLNGQTFNNIRLYKGTCYSTNPPGICTSSCGCNSKSFETTFITKYQGEPNSSVLSCRIRYKSATEMSLVTYEGLWTAQHKSYSRKIDQAQQIYNTRQHDSNEDGVSSVKYENSQPLQTAVFVMLFLCCLAVLILPLYFILRKYITRNHGMLSKEHLLREE